MFTTTQRSASCHVWLKKWHSWEPAAMVMAFNPTIWDGSRAHTHELSGLDYPTELACKLVWVTLRQDMLGTVPFSLSQAWSCESFRRHKSYTLYHQHWALFVGHGQPLFGDHTPTLLPDLPERSGGWGNGRHLHGVYTTYFAEDLCFFIPREWWNMMKPSKASHNLGNLCP